MPKLKYMGTSDLRDINKGDTFGGRLPDGLSVYVKWDASNNWIVDTDALGLSADEVELILTEDNFKDVTDLKRVPTNEHQRMFLGMKGGEEPEEAFNDSASRDEPAANDEDKASSGSVVGGGPTTTGGSTSGTTGGGRGGRAGGSTRTS